MPAIIFHLGNRVPFADMLQLMVNKTLKCEYEVRNILGIVILNICG